MDGLAWMSRQRDRDAVLLLFGDRVPPAALSGTRVVGPLRTNDVLRHAILALALRVDIEA